MHDKSGILIDHGPSGRRYEQFFDGEQIWHQESVAVDSDRDGQTDLWIQTAKWPVRYVIGSGAMAEGYLLGDGAHLIQSPVTWYASHDDFDMAPGYEGPGQVGMTREVSRDCLACHTGWVKAISESPFETIVGERSIGCQRCHGPGRRHVEFHRGDATQPSDFGTAMVHPMRLDRHSSESVCAQCHLEGSLMLQPGVETIHDFRPGDDIDRFRVVYHVTERSPDGSIMPSTFVGHFDQMWQSECYLRSDTLTCVTCHSPHQAVDPDERLSQRRRQCLQCHNQEDARHVGCAVHLVARQSANGNDCIDCHMPSTDSEVAHSPTTNHRIAIYGSQKDAPEKEAMEVRRINAESPVLDYLKVARLDRLAQAQAVVKQLHAVPVSSETFRREWESLQTFRAEVTDDAELTTLTARAMIQWLQVRDRPATRDHWQQVARLAGRAIADFKAQREKAPTQDEDSSQAVVAEAEIAALDCLAIARFELEQYEQAATTYRRLTRLRRKSNDWYNLGLCLGHLREFDAVQAAMSEAIRVDATNPLPYQSLGKLLTSSLPEFSKQYTTFSQWLRSVSVTDATIQSDR